MIETLRQPASIESLRPEPVEAEPFRQFRATFDQIAALTEEGRLGREKKIQLTHIKNYLWEQRESGLLRELPAEKDEFMGTVESIAGSAHYTAGLIEGELVTVFQGRKNRSIRLYSPEEISNLGIITWYYLEEKDRGRGVWERVKTKCQESFPGRFEAPSEKAEEELPPETTAKDIINRWIYFSLVTKGKEYNDVDGYALEGGRISLKAVTEIRWLWAVLQGSTRVLRNDNDLDNATLLNLFANFGDYLARNNLTYGEAKVRAEMMLQAEVRRERSGGEAGVGGNSFSRQGLEDYLRQEGIAVGRKNFWGALNSLEIKYTKVRSPQGGEVYQIPLTPRQLEDLVAILKS